MCALLKRIGVSGKVVNIIRSMYEKTKGTITSSLSPPVSAWPCSTGASNTIPDTYSGQGTLWRGQPDNYLNTGS